MLIKVIVLLLLSTLIITQKLASDKETLLGGF
jgi:hypothetical protein